MYYYRLGTKTKFQQKFIFLSGLPAFTPIPPPPFSGQPSNRSLPNHQTLFWLLFLTFYFLLWYEPYFFDWILYIYIMFIDFWDPWDPPTAKKKKR